MRRAFTLLELLLVLAILAILLALFLPAVQKVRAASTRAQCASQLRQLALAVHSYHDAQRHLPPARFRFDRFTWPRSWLYFTLPYLEQEALHQRASDDAGFAAASLTAIPSLLCPADARDLTPPFVGTVGGASGEFGLTSYAGVIGTRQVFYGPTDGMFDTGNPRGWRFADVSDGLSTTLMLGERPPSPDLEWGWWSYSDFDTLLSTQANWSPYLNCPRPTVFAPGDLVDPCASVHFWSPHDAGGNWALGDGSVRWIGYSGAALTIPMSTRAGGEPITPE